MITKFLHNKNEYIFVNSHNFKGGNVYINLKVQSGWEVGWYAILALD